MARARKLKPTEVSGHSALGCLAPRCQSSAVVNGDGFDMPFCRDHLEQLRRRDYDELAQLSRASIFDHRAEARANSAVRRASQRMAAQLAGGI